MGGTIIINEETAWMPQSGMVQLALAGLSAQLRRLDDELADDMVHPTKGYEWALFIFRELEPKRFQLLYPAMERFYSQKAKLGPSGCHRPDDYAWIMLLLSFLKVLIRVDPRSGQNAQLTGKLKGHAGYSWTGPLWVYDFILETLSADLYLQDLELSQDLHKCRSFYNRTVCDLSKLKVVQYRQLQSNLKALHDGLKVHRCASGARKIFVELFPQFSSLEKLFAADGFYWLTDAHFDDRWGANGVQDIRYKYWG